LAKWLTTILVSPFVSPFWLVQFSENSCYSATNLMKNCDDQNGDSHL